MIARLLLVLLALAAPALAARADDLGSCAGWAAETGRPEMQSKDTDHRLLCHEGYLAAYNFANKTPDWVLEVLTPDRLVKTVARDGFPFIPDPLVDRKDSAVTSDYNRSGYDRGHMSPAADNTWKREAMEQSFYLSNIAPQYGPSMNRGIWKDLETLVRDWTLGRKRVIAISGPVYGATPRSIGENKVAVPDGFFKVVYDPATRRAIGFYFDNRPYPRAELADFITPIRDIEEKTGITFFPALSPRTRKILLANKGLMWR